MKKKSTTPTLDDDTPITQADIDDGKLILRKRSAGRVVLPKKRVTLYLDAALVEHFKHMAGERGYQTLINETLKSSVQTADIAETVRRVIREELKGRKAA
ncbi:BrnA antitoxin family protein [Sulfuritalea sp.]|uniref:BrnA antitoxin family protein n=1 Tax=Sulfuritalea sp. TaxID=2480090 RepID=UPI00286EB396|nr:BrnA antitoxin family protein [Sulfuritalea sp.]